MNANMKKKETLTLTECGRERQETYQKKGKTEKTDHEVKFQQ
jgi:hypothetical protein